MLLCNQSHVYKGNNFDKSNIQSSNQSLKVLSIDKNRSIFLSHNDKEEQFQTISKEDWITQDIKSGLPLINKINTIKYIPQMLNLDKLNAISFSKGCYTGQEVVARVQHRGKIKQRMYKLAIDINVLLDEKSEIVNIDKKVGSILISHLNKN